MKKTLAKILAIVMCAVLLVTGSIYITLAYLQTQTQVVTNTFTTSNISLTLTETKIGDDGKPVDGADRVIANSYKLTPGAKYVKDPTVFVGANSEQCFVVIAIHDEIFAGTGIEATGNTIYDQIEANGWVELEDCHIKETYLVGSMEDWKETTTTEVDGVTQTTTEHNYTLYYYAGPMGENTAATIAKAGDELVIFEEFTLSSTIQGDYLEDYNNKTFEVVAFGMQTTDYTSTGADTPEQIFIAFTSTFGEEA